MKFSLQKFAICLSAAFLITSTFESGAFALLGPVQPWMQTTNAIIQPGDIGGPMCISNGYRWNVPVVTYGFDKSFLDYFGSNGVAAVESAIQIMNDLPPASQIVLTNYPINSLMFNYAAGAQSLYDLKSQTLSILLEQIGLAEPIRNVFVLRQWNPVFLSDPTESEWPAGTIPNYIVQRNFDPQTLNVSPYVNSTLYTADVDFGFVPPDLNEFVLAIFPVMIPLNYNPAAADFNPNDPETAVSPGAFLTGLTYDDVDGLVYLLSTNTINYEMLLPGIIGVGTNANSFVNGAWRPGVDKITFIPQPIDSQSCTFLPTTNYFTDSYITNGILKQQQMARIISQPDFIFSAGDVTFGGTSVPFLTQTGTTNWLNNATANGSTNGAGPGVIQPQVQIVFNKLGWQFATFGNSSGEQVFDSFQQFWASFDLSTNAPILYPIPQTGTNRMTVRMWLVMGSPLNLPSWKTTSFQWKPSSAAGASFAMQTSTDLANWTTLFTVTNNGSVCTYFNDDPTNPSSFYRLIPQ